MITNAKAERASPSTNWVMVVVTLVLSWLLPLLTIWFSRNEAALKALPSVVSLGAFVLPAIFLAFRGQVWSVILWIPLVAGGFIGSASIALAILSQPSGGPSAAPLEGVTTLIGLGLIVFLIALTASCLIWRPKIFVMPVVKLAIINAVAVLSVTVNGMSYATGQDIILHVIDREQTPVAGASVFFERYGYGPGGSNFLDKQGGPIVSDEQGTVIIPSRRMRYETRVTITKPGYRDLTLTVGMQFNESDKHRRFVLSTRRTRAIAQGKLPATDPVHANVSLASATDEPHPAVERFGLYSKTDVGDAVPRFLDIETGKFSANQAGDLELEAFAEFTGDRWETRLRITGLNGTQVLQVPHESSLTEPLTPFEHLYRIAPESGYASETIVIRPGDTPGPTIYIRARDGHLHGRMELNAQGNGRDPKVRYSGSLAISKAGDRRLE